METEKTLEPIDLIAILGRFFRVLRRFWILVAVLAVLGAGANFVRARQNFRPYYESKAIFSVSSGYAENDIFTNSYYYDTASTSQLVSSFPSLLSTDIMRDLIIAQLDKNYINGTIIPSCIADTNIFELTVRSTDPQDAYDILCAVIEAYPQVMVYAVDDPQLIIRQSPILPETPVNSFDPVSPLVKGGFLGLILGLGIVLLVTLATRTVDTCDDLKKLVNLPILGTMPHVTEKKRRNAAQPPLHAADDSAFKEAVRGLRTKIYKQLASQGGKVVLLTSTLPGEGKSTISASLAKSLAADGSRVVLVDADLRNQSISRILGGDQQKKGLMELLRNPKATLGDQLSHVDGTNLYYISGQSTQMRHYGIDAKAMRRLMETLTQGFDYVILDSPPCGIVSDTALLARYADCVLYVVKHNFANSYQILDAVTALEERDIPLSGTILNDVPKNRYGRGYGYGYGYGYGGQKKYGYDYK